MSKIKERIRQLQGDVERSRTIVVGLADNESFKLLLDDFRKTVEQADASWHLMNLDDKQQLGTFNQLRAMKLAASQLTSVLENYQYNMQRAEAEITELENSDDDEETSTVNSYYEE